MPRQNSSSTHERLENGQRSEHQQQRDAADANCLRRDPIANPLANAGAEERGEDSLGDHRRDGADQTTNGDENLAAIVAAVSCPTSPHSDKNTAANATRAPFDNASSFFTLGWSGFIGFRHSVQAIPMKLSAVIVATIGRGSRAMASPTATATAIFAMNAAVIPIMIGIGRYRVARMPVVYNSLSPTISARNTARVCGEEYGEHDDGCAAMHV